MSGIFVFGDGPARAAEMVGFAQSLGEKCVVLAAGESGEAYANIGADTVLYLGGEMPESYAKAIARLLKEKEAALFAVAMSAVGRELAARVAGYLDCVLVSDVSDVAAEDGGFTAERMMYGGAVVRPEHFDGLGIVTVPTGKYPPAEGAAEVLSLNAVADNRVSVVSSAPIVREGVDITAAEKVVGAGMGFSTREELELAYKLAAALGAEVGCTRSLAEDQHWFSEYIGLSGVQLSPKLYVALGISGQIQHTVGVRGSQVIVAINRDEKAPILSGCDYGMVGDMYELVPMLIEALGK